jgi:hypothetical protein
VLSIGDGITNNRLKERLQDSTGLFVDQSRDTLDTTTAGKTTNSRLGDTLDVITQNLSVTLSTTLSKALSTFSTSRWLVLDTFK